MKKTLIEVRELKKYFPLAKDTGLIKKRGVLRANDGVSFALKEGEVFGVVGESGSGKSTLGKAVLQLITPTAGSVLYTGKTLEELLPKYLFKTLKNAEKHRQNYQKTGLKEQSTKLAAGIFGGFLCLDKEPFLESVRLLNGYFFSLKKGDKIKAQQAQEQLNALRNFHGENEAFAALEWERKEGVELTLLQEKEMRALRRDLQIIFQDPYSSLNPRKTVEQIIEEGLIEHKLFKGDKTARREYLLSLVRDCGLQAYMLSRYPHQFSGGQRQRVCIARALAVKPKFVVCDECVSALDVSVQSQILNLLADLKKKRGLTYLFISHDLGVVRHLCDRVAVLYFGKIVEQGSANALFEKPLHPYTVALISALPDVHGGGERIVVKGQPPTPTGESKGCPFAPRCFMAQDVCYQKEPLLKEWKRGRWAACHFADIPLEEKYARAKEGLEGEKEQKI